MESAPASASESNEYNYFLSSPVLTRLKQLRVFYDVQVFLIVCSCFSQFWLLIGPSSKNDCQIGYWNDIRVMLIMQLILQPVLLFDMIASRRAVGRFVSEYIATPDVVANLRLKALFNYLCSINSGEGENSRFMHFVQVREAMWKVNSIRGSACFLITHLFSWILFVSSAYFRLLIDTSSTCSVVVKFAQTAFEFPYHTVWIIGIEIAALVVFIVSVLVIPFVVCMYFRSQISGEPSFGGSSSRNQNLNNIQLEFVRTEAQIKQDKKEFLEKMIETKQFIETSAKDKMCAICLDEFVEHAEIKVAKCCRSEFHDRCIQSWVETKPNCPNCRESAKSKLTKAKRNQRNTRVYPLNIPNNPNSTNLIIAPPPSLPVIPTSASTATAIQSTAILPNSNNDIENQRFNQYSQEQQQQQSPSAPMISSLNEVILPQTRLINQSQQQSLPIRIAYEAAGNRVGGRNEDEGEIVGEGSGAIIQIMGQELQATHVDRGHNCSINLNQSLENNQPTNLAAIPQNEE